MQIPKQQQLILPIVEAIDDLGGSAPTGKIRDAVARGLGIPREIAERRALIGGQDHNILAHSVRWAQQKAKLAGLIEKDEGRSWRITRSGRDELTKAKPGKPVTIFLTNYGAALWSLAEDAAGLIDEASLRLLLASPPYALNTKKKYGNVAAGEYVDWLTRILERLMPCMKTDGSIVLNIGDSWQKGMPAINTVQERLVIALEDRLGLKLCQRLMWQNTSALPTPTNYVGIQRIRLKQALECLWWFTPHPDGRAYADNRAILEPYSDRMKRVIASGGQGRSKRPSGHASREGAFSNDNGGSIAPNIFRVPNSGDQTFSAACREAKLPVHPARMPLELARRLIAFLSQEGETIFDPFGGSSTTGKAAEELGRQWITTEAAREYVEAARLRFEPASSAHAA